MRILHTMLRVNDLEESLAFYTEVLGMKLLRRKDYESGRFTLAFIGYGEESEGETADDAEDGGQRQQAQDQRRDAQAVLRSGRHGGPVARVGLRRCGRVSAGGRWRIGTGIRSGRIVRRVPRGWRARPVRRRRRRT